MIDASTATAVTWGVNFDVALITGRLQGIDEGGNENGDEDGDEGGDEGARRTPVVKILSSWYVSINIIINTWLPAYISRYLLHISTFIIMTSILSKIMR